VSEEKNKENMREGGEKRVIRGRRFGQHLHNQIFQVNIIKEKQNTF
jgi:hypothetical protein